MNFFLRLPGVIWLAISQHILYGVGLLMLDNDPTLVGLLGGFGQFISLLGKDLTGVMLLAVAIIAALGFIFERHLSRVQMIATLMPQYAVLFLALVAGLEVIISGLHVTTNSGQQVTVDRVLVMLGVGPVCLVALWHTLAILQRLRNPRIYDELAIEMEKCAKLEAEYILQQRRIAMLEGKIVELSGSV